MSYRQLLLHACPFAPLPEVCFKEKTLQPRWQRLLSIWTLTLSTASFPPCFLYWLGVAEQLKLKKHIFIFQQDEKGRKNTRNQLFFFPRESAKCSQCDPVGEPVIYYRMFLVESLQAGASVKAESELVS